MSKKEIGQRIRDLRIEFNMSQDDLAGLPGYVKKHPRRNVANLLTKFKDLLYSVKSKVRRCNHQMEQFYEECCVW